MISCLARRNSANPSTSTATGTNVLFTKREYSTRTRRRHSLDSTTNKPPRRWSLITTTTTTPEVELALQEYNMTTHSEATVRAANFPTRRRSMTCVTEQAPIQHKQQTRRRRHSLCSTATTNSRWHELDLALTTTFHAPRPVVPTLELPPPRRHSLCSHENTYPDHVVTAKIVAVDQSAFRNTKPRRRGSISRGIVLQSGTTPKPAGCNMMGVNTTRDKDSSEAAIVGVNIAHDRPLTPTKHVVTKQLVSPSLPSPDSVVAINNKLALVVPSVKPPPLTSLFLRTNGLGITDNPNDIVRVLEQNASNPDIAILAFRYLRQAVAVGRVSLWPNSPWFGIVQSTVAFHIGQVSVIEQAVLTIMSLAAISVRLQVEMVQHGAIAIVLEVLLTSLGPNRSGGAGHNNNDYLQDCCMGALECLAPGIPLVGNDGHTTCLFDVLESYVSTSKALQYAGGWAVTLAYASCASDKPPASARRATLGKCIMAALESVTDHVVQAALGLLNDQLCDTSACHHNVEMKQIIECIANVLIRSTTQEVRGNAFDVLEKGIKAANNTMDSAALEHCVSCVLVCMRTYASSESVQIKAVSTLSALLADNTFQAPLAQTHPAKVAEWQRMFVTRMFGAVQKHHNSEELKLLVCASAASLGREILWNPATLGHLFHLLLDQEAFVVIEASRAIKEIAESQASLVTSFSSVPGSISSIVECLAMRTAPSTVQENLCLVVYRMVASGDHVKGKFLETGGFDAFLSILSAEQSSQRAIQLAAKTLVGLVEIESDTKLYSKCQEMSSAISHASKVSITNAESLEAIVDFAATLCEKVPRFVNLASILTDSALEMMCDNLESAAIQMYGLSLIWLLSEARLVSGLDKAIDKLISIMLVHCNNVELVLEVLSLLALLSTEPSLRVAIERSGTDGAIICIMRTHIDNVRVLETSISTLHAVVADISVENIAPLHPGLLGILVLVLGRHGHNENVRTNSLLLLQSFTTDQACLESMRSMAESLISAIVGVVDKAAPLCAERAEFIVRKMCLSVTLQQPYYAISLPM